MRIGVIGVGEMGGTLARGWRAQGHVVAVANSRGPEAVRPFAEEIGARATDVQGWSKGLMSSRFAWPSRLRRPCRATCLTDAATTS